MNGSYTVKPSEPTWQGVMPLSVFDQIGTITHELTIYIYRRPQNNCLSPPEAIMDALKDSLGRALSHFYPLAGRVRWSGEGGSRLELHCNAMGAMLREAEADAELYHFLGHDFSLSRKYRYLIPAVDYSLPLEEIPLLLVQLTRFACGGISLGCTVSHTVADGRAAFYFMSEWARLARGEPLKTAPFLDRGVLQAGEPPREYVPEDPADYYLPELMVAEKSKGFDDQDGIKMDKTAMARLKLRQDQVENLKKMANERREESETANRAYTRFEALAAHIWRCVSKARNHEFPEQPTALGVTVDSRSRVHPPLPQNYFGNAVFDVLANSASGELLSKPLGYAASRIRAAIAKVNSEFVGTAIDYLKSIPDLAWLQNIGPVLHGTPSIMNPNLGIISWLGLPNTDGHDFGWGKEIYMGPGEIDGESCYVLPCPSGDGSVIVVLCLQAVHMDSFKKHFYDDIA